ncbi:MAG: hypothetical protein MR357_07280 [Anaeroplasma sp.]|nr:hypothetical protein [Anaeroplasma sp.]
MKDRSVYYGEDFAIRFSQSENRRMSNTVLSLSALQKYDDKPFIVCIVTSKVNYMMLANTTFLKKISHSSQELRVDNIKGSFNGGDIMMKFESIENEPAEFERLFAYHSGFSFQDNLERLVESTNGIIGRVQKFDVNKKNKTTIMGSVDRAIAFADSSRYDELKKDLDDRVAKVQGEIAIAAFIDNVNVRGRIIEYLITDNGSKLKDQIISALKNKTPLPQFKTEDKLGDYSRSFPEYVTETDIKTKVLFLDGNPKAYNIDKLLEFLATEKSVYMIYLLGIDDDGTIIARLCSAFDSRLVEATNVIHHWAGRNSRGVAQFIGHALTQILNDKNGTTIDSKKAYDFVMDLINR